MSHEDPNALLRASRMMAITILFSMCLLTALGILFALRALPIENTTVDPGAAKILDPIFLAIGIGTIGLSHVMRSMLDKLAGSSPTPARARYTATIVSMALGETAATLALLAGILTHNVTTVLLLGVAAIITGLLHFPRTVA